MLRALFRALNEADVAVYPVDARGVTVAAAFQADRSSTGKRTSRPRQPLRPISTTKRWKPGRRDRRPGVPPHQRSEHGDSGGGQRRAGELLAGVFASGANLDGTYHRLEVTVKRPSVKLRYRPGYVAARDTAVAPSLAEAIANPVPLTAIGFSVHLEPVEGGYKAAVTIDPRTSHSTQGWDVDRLVAISGGGGEGRAAYDDSVEFHRRCASPDSGPGSRPGCASEDAAGDTGFSLGFRDVPSGMVGTLHVPL